MVALGCEDFADNHRAFNASVLAEHADRVLDRATHDLGTDLLIALEDESIDDLRSAEQRDAAAGDDTLFHRSAGGVESVFDAGLLFLHLNFGGGTDVDDGDAAGQLGETLLELLTIIVGSGLVDLATDLLHAALDIGRFSRAFDDGGVLLVDDDPLGAAEVGDGEALELEAEIVGDALATGEDSDVFEHSLAAITEARSLDGAHVDRAADLVNDEGRESFAFNFLSDDEEGLAALGDNLEQGKELLEVRNLLFVDQHIGVLEDGLLGLGVGREVGGKIALVELHTFDDVEGGLDGLCLFNGDGAVFADLIHGVSNDIADRLVPVGGDGGDLADFLAVIDLLGNAREFLDGGLDGLVDTALEEDRVGTGGHVLETLAVDTLGEHGRGGRAVTGSVGGLGSDFLYHLSTHVLIGIWELDLFGDGHAVLGDGRRSEFFVDDDVAALGSKGDFHRAREELDATEDFLTSGLVEDELFSGHVYKFLVED